MIPRRAIRGHNDALLLNTLVSLNHPINECYFLGGAALGDTSEGLSAYLWHAWTDGSQIYIQALRRIQSESALTQAPQSVYTGAEITEVSAAFDQNMNLVLAFVEQGAAKLRTYHNASGEYRITDLPEALSPRVTLDYPAHLASSDVILAYVQNGTLYANTQRENYQDRQVIFSGIGDGWFLRHIGLSVRQTFHFVMMRRECYETETGLTYPPP